MSGISTGSPDAIKVVVADDHTYYRAGLVGLLRRSGVEVVAEAASGDQAIEATLAHAPDVTVMDLHMPGLSGTEATRILRERAPATRVLVLTVSAEADDITRAVLAGAAGYLLKDDSIDSIVAGIGAAADGHALITPRVASQVLHTMREDHPPAATAAEPALSAREIEVLALVTDGRANAEIAEALVISESTVRNHISSVLEKLGVDNRVQAAVRAVRDGIVQ